MITLTMIQMVMMHIIIVYPNIPFFFGFGLLYSFFITVEQFARWRVVSEVVFSYIQAEKTFDLYLGMIVGTLIKVLGKVSQNREKNKIVDIERCEVIAR